MSGAAWRRATSGTVPLGTPVRSGPCRTWMSLGSEDFGCAMARKHRLRFGLPDVFAGRLLVLQGRRWRIANSVYCAVALVGAPGSGLLYESAATRFLMRSRLDSKSPRPIYRPGLQISCDVEHMPVICPTCQQCGWSIAPFIVRSPMSLNDPTCRGSHQPSEDRSQIAGVCGMMRRKSSPGHRIPNRFLRSPTCANSFNSACASLPLATITLR